MRIGNNPEKKNINKITYKTHRVIIPVYIPNSKCSYFDNLFSVLKKSLESLLKTTNSSVTNITIINNNCRKEVTEYLDDLLSENLIDKHVKMSFNYGKIYTVLAEAKSSYENVITIADADVFYFSDWYQESIRVLNTFKKVGVVAPLPMPQLAYYNNNSLFFHEFFNLKKGNLVNVEDLKLFEKSINSKISLKKENWFNKQLYLKKRNAIVCIGAGHFIATYRKELLDEINIDKPIYIFEDGAENYHIDSPIDKLGYYRVSTLKTYVYHLGNTIPKWIDSYKFTPTIETNSYVNFTINKTVIPYKVKNIFSKIYRKLTTI